MRRTHQTSGVYNYLLGEYAKPVAEVCSPSSARKIVLKCGLELQEPMEMIGAADSFMKKDYLITCGSAHL